MSDWICADDDSLALERFVVELAEEGVERAGAMLDELGLSSDPRCERLLALVSALIEAESWLAIAQARWRAGATAGPALH